MSDAFGYAATNHPLDFEAFQWGSEDKNVKECNACRETFPLDCFYKKTASKDGHQSQCKKCFDERRSRKRPLSEIEGDDEFLVTEEIMPDSLYTMENPRISGEVKVGRSHNPEERAKQLSAGNNFRLAVKQVYVGKGYLEKTVHQRLKARRVEEVAGTEWFKISTYQADTIIKAAILEDDLSRPF